MPVIARHDHYRLRGVDGGQHGSDERFDHAEDGAGKAEFVMPTMK